MLVLRRQREHRLPGLLHTPAVLPLLHPARRQHRPGFRHTGVPISRLCFFRLQYPGIDRPPVDQPAGITCHQAPRSLRDLRMVQRLVHKHLAPLPLVCSDSRRKPLCVIDTSVHPPPAGVHIPHAVQPGLRAHAAAIRPDTHRNPGRVIHPVSLHPAYNLFKSSAVFSGDR